MAFWAMDLPVGSCGLTLFMATNHWSVSMGSITWPVRVHTGTMFLWGTAFCKKPCSSRSLSTALRHT